MNGGGLVVEWRGRSFLVDLAPGGVSVTEAGAPATPAAREAVVELALSRLLSERARKAENKARRRAVSR